MKALLILCVLGLAGCSLSELGPASYAPAETVRSSEVMRIAESYRLHPWTPTQANVFHGYDEEGILVNTPNHGYAAGRGTAEGWWKVNEQNTGVPYMWGGFDTPLSFNQKLVEGYYAGDVYTSEKRKALYAGVSKEACGVDCSGFISRCWRLKRAHSTRELPSISTELASFKELKTGDIINKYNEHVVLFERFTDENKTHFIGYQTGGPSMSFVSRGTLLISYLEAEGYKPYRYQKMTHDLEYPPGRREN